MPMEIKRIITSKAVIQSIKRQPIDKPLSSKMGATPINGNQEGCRCTSFGF